MIEKQSIKDTDLWVCVVCDKNCRVITRGKGKPMDRCLFSDILVPCFKIRLLTE